MTSPDATGVSGLMILGYSLMAIGIVGGIGGVLARPVHGWTYVIGGLILTTAGAALASGLPVWMPLALLWITVVVIAVYLVVMLHTQWYLLAVSALAVLAIGVFFTWLITRK